MRVLHVIDSAGLYGAEVMLLSLATEQLALGLSPMILSIGEPGLPEKPLEIAARKHGIKVQSLQLKPGLNFFGALKILKYARTENVDIIHSHGYKGNILLGIIPACLRRKPLLTTLHGWTATTKLSKIGLYVWLDKLCLRFIDRIVAVNPAMMARKPLATFRPGKVVAINNGIAPLPESAEMNIDHVLVDYCNAHYVVGSVGRLSVEKGYDQLISAFAEVIKTNAQVRLMIIGEGNQREALVALAKKLDVVDKIILPGYRDDAHQYIRLFKMYVISSITEGLPITLLEAMRAQIPVVATSVGGIPAALENGKGGLLVNPGDQNALAAAIRATLSDPEAAMIRAQCSFSELQSRYTSRQMAIEYVSVYHDVIKGVP